MIQRSRVVAVLFLFLGGVCLATYVFSSLPWHEKPVSSEEVTNHDHRAADRLSIGIPQSNARSARAPLMIDAGSPSAVKLENSIKGFVTGTGTDRIGGCPVELYRREGLDCNVPDKVFRQRAVLLNHTITGSDGAFLFSVESGVTYELRAHPVGYCERSIAPCYAGQEITILCTVGAGLFGSLSLENGVPAEGTVVAYLDGHLGGTSSAAAQARPSYSLDCLLPGDYSLSAFTEAGPTETVRIHLSEGERVERSFVFHKACTLEVSISDARNGEPILGARVSRERLDFLSDDSGVALIRGCRPNSDVTLSISANHYARTELECHVPAAETSSKVSVTLAPGARVRGVVVDAQTRPIPDAYIAAVGSVLTVPISKQDDVRSTTSSPDGLFSIDDVRIDRRQCLMVSKQGYGTRAIPCPLSNTDDLDIGHIQLENECVLYGDIWSAGNPSTDDCVVTLIRAELPDYPNWLISPSFQKQVGTDSIGHFCVRALDAGTYWVTADCSHCSRRPREMVEVKGSQSHVALYLDGASIVGSVIGPDSQAIIGCLVSIRSEGRPQANYRPVSTDASGRFEIHGLIEHMTYTLQTHYLSNHRAAGDRPLASVTVSGIPDGADNVRIVVPYGRLIRVQLHDPTRVFDGLTVYASDNTTKDVMWTSSVLADGTCDVIVPETAYCVVSVSGRQGLFAAPVLVEPNTNAIDISALPATH